MRARPTLVGLVAGAGGGLTAIATFVVAQDWWGWLLGVAATAALLHALSPGLRLRGMAAIGWAAALVVVLLGRPGGDRVLDGDARGIGLVAVAALNVLYAAATLPRMEG